MLSPFIMPLGSVWALSLDLPLLGPDLRWEGGTQICQVLQFPGLFPGCWFCLTFALFVLFAWLTISVKFQLGFHFFKWQKYLERGIERL